MRPTGDPERAAQRSGLGHRARGVGAVAWLLFVPVGMGIPGGTASAAKPLWPTVAEPTSRTSANVRAHVGAFVGEWRNENPDTLGTTRYVISTSGGDLAISGYGRCTPSECDWAAAVGGPRTTPQSDAVDGRLSVVWPFGFKTQSDDLQLLADGRLRVDQAHDYAEGDSRPDRGVTEFFRRATPAKTFFAVVVVTAGDGSVVSDPIGIACPPACSLEFEAASTVTLHATPAEGNRFRGWSGACAGVAPSCTVNLTAGLSVEARFSPPAPCVTPRLTGRTLRAARAALSRAHCVLGAVSRAWSARFRRGVIIKQRPRPGMRLANGARVAVTVSRGPRS